MQTRHQSNNPRPHITAFLLTLVCLACGASPPRDVTVPPQPDWPQWAGPYRSFEATPVALATTWPPSGPDLLWRRPLGEGYAGLTVQDGRVLTQFREGDNEHLVALDTATGEERWRVTHHEPADGFSDRFGLGPYTTPAVDAGRAFAISSGGLVFAVDTAQGRRLWQRDIWVPDAADRAPTGYTASPLLMDDLLFVSSRDTKPAIIALDVRDGRVIWQGGDFELTHSSPVIATWREEAHLVVFGKDAVAGLDPATGDTRWTLPHPNPNGANITTPLWSTSGGLFLSSGPEKGSRLLRFASDRSVTEAWSTPRFRVFFTNALWLEDTLYGASGGVAAATLSAVDAATGDLLWRDRQVGRANLVHAGALTVALDDEGRLFLLRLSRQGVEVLAEAKIFDDRTWTGPTLVGNRLYLRDRTDVVALALPLADS